LRGRWGGGGEWSKTEVTASWTPYKAAEEVDRSGKEWGRGGEVAGDESRGGRGKRGEGGGC